MLTKREMNAFCGDISQLLGIRKCILAEGKSKGAAAYHLRNGQGLEMLVLPDKNFTIAELYFNNINVGFTSKTGICAPEFYQEEGTRGFLRNFEAGFLTTCGITYMGTPGIENGQANGLHGTISNTPAEETFHGVRWIDDIPWIEFGGQVREAHLFGPNIRLHRKFRISTTENKIWIHDRVENLGFEKEPLMLLYHFNIGYPMLNETCIIHTNMNNIVCRDGENKKSIEKCNEFEKPIIGYKEEVFFRTNPDKNQPKGKVLLHNKKDGKSLFMQFDTNELPVLNQWKNPCAGDYALGLEPGTCHVGGRLRAKQENILQYIDAGESKSYHLELEFIDLDTQMSRFEDCFNSI